MEEEEKKYPLECVICGVASGPLHKLDVECYGWMCPDCYKKLTENDYGK